MIEELAEDLGVGEGDVAIQRAKCRDMNGPGGEEQRHQVNISSGDAVRGKIKGKKADDRSYYESAKAGITTGDIFTY